MAQKTQPKKPAAPTPRVHVSFRINGALATRMRAAVRHLKGAPLFLVLDDVAEAAIDKAVAALEKKHNAGRPFA